MPDEATSSRAQLSQAQLSLHRVASQASEVSQEHARQQLFLNYRRAAETQDLAHAVQGLANTVDKPSSLYFDVGYEDVQITAVTTPPAAAAALNLNVHPSADDRGVHYKETLRLLEAANPDDPALEAARRIEVMSAEEFQRTVKNADVDARAMIEKSAEAWMLARRAAIDDQEGKSSG